MYGAVPIPKQCACKWLENWEVPVPATCNKPEPLISPEVFNSEPVNKVVADILSNVTSLPVWRSFTFTFSPLSLIWPWASPTAEPDIVPVGAVAEAPSKVSSLVLIELLGAVNEPDITVPVKVRIRVAFVPNEPDISFLLALSVARLELVATNEPDITAPVNDLINAALAPNEPETDAAVIIFVEQLQTEDVAIKIYFIL